MIGINAFNQDVENCNIKRCPLIERYSINDADDGLKAIDELFADADAVSKQSYVKTNRYRLSLAICAFLFAFFVLHYGNKESNLIITGGCLILISIMYYLNIFFKNKKRHTKHIQYRFLAESLRAQFFISYAGINENVTNLMPETVKFDIWWILEFLSALPKSECCNPNSISIFLKNQIYYHQKVMDTDNFARRMYSFCTKFAIYLTVFAYIIAFLFEVYRFIFSPVIMNIDQLYFYFKLFLVLVSLITIVANGVLGKLNLDYRIGNMIEC